MLLSGKKAIVTGGNGGIGKSIAEKLALEGADVAIFGTNTEKGEQAVSEINAHGKGKASFHKIDVSKSSECEGIIQELLKSFGNVDILVNNAGITRDGLLMRMSEEDWEQVMAINLKSVFNLSKALMRPMMKARYGRIINISSVVGITGNAGQTNYSASKAGMIGFTKSLAQEVATRGITVNCVAPGFIQTAMTGALNEEQQKAILGKIPMGRMGSVEDIAEAVLFLASDKSSYITGQVLTVDGGMVM